MSKKKDKLGIHALYRKRSAVTFLASGSSKTLTNRLNESRDVLTEEEARTIQMAINHLNEYLIGQKANYENIIKNQLIQRVKDETESQSAQDNSSEGLGASGSQESESASDSNQESDSTESKEG